MRPEVVLLLARLLARRGLENHEALVVATDADLGRGAGALDRTGELQDLEAFLMRVRTDVRKTVGRATDEVDVLDGLLVAIAHEAELAEQRVDAAGQFLVGHVHLLGVHQLRLGRREVPVQRNESRSPAGNGLGVAPVRLEPGIGTTQADALNLSVGQAVGVCHSEERVHTDGGLQVLELRRGRLACQRRADRVGRLAAGLLRRRLESHDVEVNELLAIDLEGRNQSRALRAHGFNRESGTNTGCRCSDGLLDLAAGLGLGVENAEVLVVLTDLVLIADLVRLGSLRLVALDLRFQCGHLGGDLAAL